MNLFGCSVFKAKAQFGVLLTQLSVIILEFEFGVVNKCLPAMNGETPAQDHTHHRTPPWPELRSYPQGSISFSFSVVRFSGSLLPPLSSLTKDLRKFKSCFLKLWLWEILLETPVAIPNLFYSSMWQIGFTVIHAGPGVLEWEGF